MLHVALKQPKAKRMMIPSIGEDVEQLWPEREMGEALCEMDWQLLTKLYGGRLGGSAR